MVNEIIMNATLPKISIITPSYNQVEFLERTITSVLSQTYPNKEYIIMDGGSTDGSAEIIRKHEGSLAYWQSAPDGGQTDAICKGFEKATGDILLYLNSDDMLLPGALWAYAEALMGKELGWAVGRLQVVDEMDRVLAYRPAYPFSLGDLWYNLYVVHQEGTCFTRALYEKVGGFEPSYHYSMDFHMWLRMCEISPPVLIRQYTAAFRASENQKSADGAEYSKEVDRAFGDIRKWRLEQGLSEFPRRPFFRGWLFSLAKAAYYLWTGGVDAVSGMFRLHQGRQGSSMVSEYIKQNKR